MLGPYRRVLSVPGARGFSAAGLLARLPIAMLGIGIVLLVQRSTGSYGTAGAVAAVFGLAQGVGAPVVARLVDRFGQLRVIAPAIVVHVSALAALLVSTRVAPLWSTFAAAALAGSSLGSPGALVRARWSHVLAGRADRVVRLHTAYSWESVLDEVVFIGGPLLITVLAVQVSPELGIVVAAAAITTGGTALLLQRGTEPPPSGVRPARGSGLLRAPGMIVLVAAFFLVGGIFGSVEVITVAFAAEQGVPGAAGLVLASFAAGSLIAGLVYGAITWRSTPERRFVLSVPVLAVGIVPVALVDSVPLLAMVVFVAGFAISPMIIAGNGVVQGLVAASRLTEGLAWISTAIVIGIAGGAALSGFAVDAVGGHRAFVVPAVSGALAAVVVLASTRWLRPVAPAGTAP